jgi:hypothetical protein
MDKVQKPSDPETIFGTNYLVDEGRKERENLSCCNEVIFLFVVMFGPLEHTSLYPFIAPEKMKCTEFPYFWHMSFNTRVCNAHNYM